MVAELIDQNARSWKMEVITSVFNAEEVVSIHCIPLSRSIEDDMVAWMGDYIGEYSVHCGYKALTNYSNT